MKRSSSRDLAEKLEALGWELFDETGKHNKWKHPLCRLYLVAPKSPSDGRGIRNLLSLAKRLLSTHPRE